MLRSSWSGTATGGRISARAASNSALSPKDFAVDLSLTSATPVIIQGRDGVSQKAAGVGHASHYFSLPRLLTSGSIQLDGATYHVTGTSWMDHEFFTGSMAPDESGWDWVGLQFDNHTELMLYRMRHKDGTVDPFSSGSFVDARGRSTFLSAGDFLHDPRRSTSGPALKPTAATRCAGKSPSPNSVCNLP